MNTPEQIPGLPPQAFHKADTAPDAEFYRQPRFVTHIDDGAIAAVTALYDEFFPAGGDLLDLMSSWVSHLPADKTYRSVTGLGMNEQELAANPRLTARLVQDLNSTPVLPFADTSFDGAAICVSVQYLTRPVDVFRDVARVLRPGAPLIVSFSNRCFPSKAIAVWQMLSGAEQQQLVGVYMRTAGLSELATRSANTGGDPLWSVIGHRAP